MSERAEPTGEIVLAITRHPTGRSWTWVLRRGPDSLVLIGPDGLGAGLFPTVQEAVASNENVHVIRRTDHAIVGCSVLDDEAIARMLVGRRGARCRINRWWWRWRSTADIDSFVPEDHRAHPRFEEAVAELCWTCPSWPGSDWPDTGEVILSRIGAMYWWTRTAEGSRLDADVFLGRFETLEDARIELWDLLDARGYRLDWEEDPGPHPGGLMALWLPERRKPLNHDA